MKRSFHQRWVAVPVATALLSMSGGCFHRPSAGLFYQPPPTPAPLGTHVDNVFRMQEENAEAAKFIVYQHEFELNQFVQGKNVNGFRLNEYGEDHVKKIAEQLRRGVHFPVVIERNQTSAKPHSQFHYPVHFDPDLDMKRREVVVRSLVAMGIPDADQRVVVAPSFAQGYEDIESEMSYRRGIFGGFFGGGFGGGGGGGGGFGGGFF